MTEVLGIPEKLHKPRRDREHTRALILEVAGKLLARVGPEGLSLSQVAQLAGVNRGTAYHHFQTREQLLKEATAWVSANLCKEVFGADSETESGRSKLDPRTVSESLTRFAMDNPEFGRAWLYDMLSSDEPSEDPFWKLYRKHIDNFTRSERAEPGVDSEVHAMMMVVGVFLWPVWTRAHEKTPKERRQLAKRYSDEGLRLCLHGVMRADKFPEFDNANKDEAEDGEAPV